MSLDIKTLVFVLFLSHIFQLIAFSYQYVINKGTYRGIGCWLLWSAAALVGFMFLMFREVLALRTFAILGQNAFIISGLICLYIGIVRFFEREENRPLLAAIFVAYLAPFLYFLLFKDDIFMRSIVLSLTIAAIAFLSVHALLAYRPPTIVASANFAAFFFLIHGCFFVYRSIMLFIDDKTLVVFAPTPLNIAMYIDALVCSIVWTFALVAMINQRLYAEIRQAKEEMDTVFNTSPDAAVISRVSDGKISYVNDKFCALSGYTRDEVIGKSALAFSFWENPEDRQKLFTALRENGFIQDFEAVFKRKGNEISYGSMSAKIINLQGEPHVISITRDITARKQAEAELRMAKEEAEASSKAKSEFLANVSHEIRTPLNAVIGFSSLALKTELTARQRDYLEKIEASAKSLLLVINDILDFSKIEAGKMELEAIVFRLDEVLEGIVGITSVKAEEKGLELIRSVGSDVPVALIGDPLRLGQVLLNLTNNAVKFTEQGYIVIKVELAERDQERCRLRFSVTDTGIGIAPEVMPKIFTAFSQADASITRRFGGTGLGLPIAGYLVEIMGGELTAVSEPGQGSTFAFSVEFGLGAAETRWSHPATADLAGLKVLVVDDNEAAREILADQLRLLGFEVAAVASGEAALKEVQETDRPYELIVMDWKMPGMDGIETTRRIREEVHLSPPPAIVMVTGFDPDEAMGKAEGLGIIAFLEKPVNLSLLLNAIARARGASVSAEESRSTATAERLGIGLRIAGARVLLVEDNALNRQVAMEILAGAGLIVETADNGRQALEALNRADYDVVLMDIQMPAMGGDEATRLIRADGRFAALPIIAMTAHAVQGYREKCLALGMNDYVSKPIDPGQLFAVLTRWIKPREAAGRMRTTGKDDRDAYLPEALPGLDIPAGLRRINGNRRLYRRLLVDFAGEYAAAVTKLGATIAGNDLAAARQFVHSLKGIAGNISATGVRAAAEALERALDAGAGGYEPLLADLEAALRTVIDGIRKLPPEKGAAEAPEAALDKERIGALVVELHGLLRSFNPEAEKVFFALKETLSGSRHISDLAALGESVTTFDFKKAVLELQKLAAAFGIAVEEGP